jgi:hypothetical protein
MSVIRKTISSRLRKRYSNLRTKTNRVHRNELSSRLMTSESLLIMLLNVKIMNQDGNIRRNAHLEEVHWLAIHFYRRNCPVNPIDKSHEKIVSFVSYVNSTDIILTNDDWTLIHLTIAHRYLCIHINTTHSISRQKLSIFFSLLLSTIIHILTTNDKGFSSFSCHSLTKSWWMTSTYVSHGSFISSSLFSFVDDSFVRIETTSSNSQHDTNRSTYIDCSLYQITNLDDDSCMFNSRTLEYARYRR